MDHMMLKLVLTVEKKNKTLGGCVMFVSKIKLKKEENESPISRRSLNQRGCVQVKMINVFVRYSFVHLGDRL
jgi:hypothetical protein